MKEGRKGVRRWRSLDLGSSDRKLCSKRRSATRAGVASSFMQKSGDSRFYFISLQTAEGALAYSRLWSKALTIALFLIFRVKDKTP